MYAHLLSHVDLARAIPLSTTAATLVDRTRCFLHLVHVRKTSKTNYAQHLLTLGSRTLFDSLSERSGQTVLVLLHHL